MKRAMCLTLALTAAAAWSFAEEGADWMDGLEHAYADNDGVRIHYVKKGEGPLVVMIHGFPDFWYSWRNQIPALAGQYTVAAMDLRGYNGSDKPEGQDKYDVEHLVKDVIAVIDAEGADKAIIVGHDWGGFISWWLAAFHPERVDRLIVCNLPHPRGLSRELAHNPKQQEMSAYARAFQQPGAHQILNVEFLASLPARGDAEAQAKYVEAFNNSDKEAMLHYYKQNFPQEPYEEDSREVPPVQAPVLLFHGLDDQALHPNALNNTWEWVAAPLSIVTVPGAEHWVHIDAADYVTGTMLDWLKRHAD